MGWARLRRGATTIDFVGKRRRWFAISAALLFASLASLGIRQLNLGIEFVGGLGMQSPNPVTATVDEVRDALAEVGVAEATIQFLDDGAAVRVATPALDQQTESAAVEALARVTGADPGEISKETVGPSFGALVAQRALLALGVFLGAVVLYISWRLEFKMAVAGLAALGHDLMITVGVYAITGFPVTPKSP